LTYQSQRFVEALRYFPTLGTYQFCPLDGCVFKITTHKM
jgi:hypothetical protein